MFARADRLRVLMARSLVRASAIGLTSIATTIAVSIATTIAVVLVASSARADALCSGCRDDDPYPERRHFAFGYERLVLSVADTTFHGGDTLPSHTGRELGFITPAANMIDFRWGFFGRHDFGLALETMIGGGAASDAVGTDPFAQQVRGDLFVMAFGVGIEGRIPLGSGVQLRADATTGPQIAMVKVSDSPRNNSLVAIQLFLRPRIALEVPIVQRFHVGAFLTDDLIRVQSWGAGGYLGFSL
jgi:hypothetical protein